MSRFFKRKAKRQAAQPKEPTPTPSPSVPLPPPSEPKSKDEKEIEVLKERWRRALSEYAHGRFSAQTTVLKGKNYFKHKVLSTVQNPGLLTETWLGLNEEMEPVLVEVKYNYGVEGFQRVDVNEQLISEGRAVEVGLTAEETLKILSDMENTTLW